MNILITGANGFVGNNLLRLLEKKHSIYTLVNGQKYCFCDNKITVNLLDIKHIKLLLREKIEIDVIIHTASKFASSFNLNEISILTDNIKMYENLTFIIKKFSPKKVINLSSIAVYPNKDGEYYENSEIKPSINSEGLYGLSKFCGENILDFMCKETNIIHLRVSQIYGQGMRNDRIFEIMKKELKETGIITVFGRGRRISGFIYIDTLLEKIIFFLNNQINGIFNINSENLSYRDLAYRIINQYGDSKSTIKFINKGVSSKTIINSDKLKSMELKYGL